MKITVREVFELVAEGLEVDKAVLRVAADRWVHVPTLRREYYEQVEKQSTNTQREAAFYYNDWRERIPADRLPTIEQFERMSIGERLKFRAQFLPIKPNTYPVVVSVSKRFLAELAACEQGRADDTAAARIERDPEAPYVVLHDFLDRHSDRIECRTAAELSELWYAVAGGTIGLHMPRAADNLLDKIREQVRNCDPEVVAMFRSANR